MASMKMSYCTFCEDDPKYGGCCQPILASSYAMARKKMYEIYGEKWAFQYSEEEWLKMKNDPNRLYPLGRELELVVVEDEV